MAATNIFSDPPKLTHARRLMVEKQLRGRGIHDERVLAAMLLVPRHQFVPPELEEQAYEDHPVSIGENQTISQPYMVAMMTQELMLEPADIVLEIGSGSGYQAAVLSRLASFVYTVERRQRLACLAYATLRGIGYQNIAVLCGDGSRGLPQNAPFDAIIVTAGAPAVPDTLVEQLADNGRLIIPVGDKMFQTCKRITKRGDRYETTDLTSCVFVPLIGRYGWEI
jgi:protein-L-isoaspartate(D-aspartate) O-methyltransferase